MRCLRPALQGAEAAAAAGSWVKQLGQSATARHPMPNHS